MPPEKTALFPLSEEKTTTDLIEHLPNLLSENEFRVLNVLLEGKTWTARQIYRKLAITEIKRIQENPNKMKIIYGPADSLNDREAEEFLMNARRVKENVEVVAYNTIQKVLKHLKEKNIAELVKQNGSRQYGLTLFFFSEWKKIRIKLQEKIEGLKPEQAAKKLGMRKIDLEFFKL